MSGGVMSISVLRGGRTEICRRKVALTESKSRKVPGFCFQQALDVHILCAEIFNPELAVARPLAILPERDPMQQEAGHGWIAKGVGERDQESRGSLHRIVLGMEVVLLDQ